MSSLKKFIEGSLSPQAEEEFVEQLITAKNDRQQQFAWQEKLKKEYNVDRNSPPSSTGKKNTFVFYGIAIIALLSIVAFFFWNQKNTISLEEQVDLQIAALDIMGDQSLLRKSTTKVDSLRKVANLAYVNQDFATSAQHWQRLTTSKDAKSSDHFYLAVSQLKQTPSDPVSALAALRRSQQDTTYQEERAWISALAYAKTRQFSNAKNLLETIIEKNTYKASSAKKLLTAIQSNTKKTN